MNEALPMSGLRDSYSYEVGPHPDHPCQSRTKNDIDCHDALVALALYKWKIINTQTRLAVNSETCEFQRHCLICCTAGL